MNKLLNLYTQSEKKSQTFRLKKSVELGEVVSKMVEDLGEVPEGCGR